MHEITIGGIKYPLGNSAVLVSSSSEPHSLADLNSFHQDPLYELISGAREAYFIKKLARHLSSEISNSAEVKNLASLINDSAREIERNWRMAACMANSPVSTGYPFLPTMPGGAALSSTASPNQAPAAVAAGQSSVTVSSPTAVSPSPGNLPPGTVKSSAQFQCALAHIWLKAVPICTDNIRKFI